MDLAVMVIAAREVGPVVARALASCAYVPGKARFLGDAFRKNVDRVAAVDFERVPITNRSLLRNRCEMVAHARACGLTHGIFLDGDDAFLPTVRAAVRAAEAIVAGFDAVWFDTLQVRRDNPEEPLHPASPLLSMRSVDWAGWPNGLGSIAQPYHAVRPDVVLSNPIGGAGAILFKLDAWPSIDEVGDRWGGEDLLYAAALAAGRTAAIRIPAVAYTTPGGGNLANDWSDGGNAMRDAMRIAEQRGFTFERMYDRDWREISVADFMARGLEWRPRPS